MKKKHVIALIQAMGMQAENSMREIRGESLAYGENQFFEIISKLETDYRASKIQLLSITAKPKRMAVYIRGDLVGFTPLRYAVAVDSGEYLDIKLKRPTKKRG